MRQRVNEWVMFYRRVLERIKTRACVWWPSWRSYLFNFHLTADTMWH